MIGNKAFVVITIVTLGVLGATSGSAQEEETGGHLKPCSLHGVNPAHHPAIFRNPDVAQEHYGFVRSSDGKWHVEKDCRKHGHHAELSVPSLLQPI
jgi:hypothetical protein